MTIKILALVLASVAMSALAQILLKFGMSSPVVQQALALDRRAEAALAILASPGVAGGLALYGLGAMVWLFVLARVDVSQAYPFVGLGFLVTMALGALLLGEQVGPVRILGTVLVAVGTVLVARS